MEKLYGWAGKILRINISTADVSFLSTGEYNDRFIGGRGIASRIYWEEMNAGTGAFDPENHIMFMNGPLSGTLVPASSRWIVLGKSPLAVPEQYAFGNLGGRFGAALKWAGLDGLDITGASKKPVILVIESGGKCSFEDAADIWGRNTFDTISSLQKKFGEKSCVATIGRAGEKLVRFANVIGSGGVSATKGFGAVMGSKNLKAVVVKAEKIAIPVARPDTLKEINREIAALWKGDSSGRGWGAPMLEDMEKVKNAYCYSCPGICGRAVYQNKNREKGYRKNCASAYFYAMAERSKTGRMGEASFHATQLANKEGLCAMELRFLVEWLPKAFQTGILNNSEEGLSPDKVGTKEWIEALTDIITSRRGIGDILAEGSRRAASHTGAEKLLEGLVTKSGFEADVYNPRLFMSTAPIYATEPVFPITQLHAVSFPMVKWMIWMGTEGAMGFLSTQKLNHLAKTFWGDEKAAEFDSPEKMGKAAAIMQNRAYSKENFILCDFFWPIDFSGNSATGTGDPALEARLFSAVTGEEMDEKGFLHSGERCLNLCRAIYLREGRRGRIDDVLDDFNFSRPLENQPPPVGLFNPELMMPGKEGKLFSCKGATFERDTFNKVMDDYYNERRWDSKTGLFTKKGLTGLELDDMIPELEAKGYLAEEN